MSTAPEVTVPKKKSGFRIPGFAQAANLTDEEAGAGTGRVTAGTAKAEQLIAEGDRVEVGQAVITYDVPAVEATGRNPIVPVVVMDSKSDSISFTDSVMGDEVAALQSVFTAR